MSQILGEGDVRPFDRVRDEVFGRAIAEKHGWGAREYLGPAIIGVSERVVDFDWVRAQGITRPVGGQLVSVAEDLIPWQGPPLTTPPDSQVAIPTVQVPESTTLFLLGVGLLCLSWGYHRLSTR